MQNHWNAFLEELRSKDIVLYNAVVGFKLHKKEEDIIKIHYPSDTAKAEFDKISSDFFGLFKHKVNHHRLELEFQNDAPNLKKEIVTKRSIFEQYSQVNPILKELNEVFKLDFN